MNELKHLLQNAENHLNEKNYVKANKSLVKFMKFSLGKKLSPEFTFYFNDLRKRFDEEVVTGQFLDEIKNRLEKEDYTEAENLLTVYQELCFMKPPSEGEKNRASSLKKEMDMLMISDRLLKNPSILDKLKDSFENEHLVD